MRTNLSEPCQIGKNTFFKNEEKEVPLARKLFLWVIVIFYDIYEDVEKQIMAADSYDHD